MDRSAIDIITADVCFASVTVDECTAVKVDSLVLNLVLIALLMALLLLLLLMLI